MTVSTPTAAGAVDSALSRYLDAVVDELRSALKASARVRSATLAGLAPSSLEEATRLEDQVAALIGAGGKLLRPSLIFLGYVAALDEVRPSAHATGDVADDVAEAPQPVANPSTGCGLDVAQTPTTDGPAAGAGEEPAAATPSRGRALPLTPVGVPAQCAPHCERSLERAAGCAPLIRLGVGIELLHLFGLLQDDVMDESATRRGEPSAHAEAAGAHRRHAPATPGAQRFGESVAVLSGDLAFALAQRELRGLPDPVLTRWDDVVLELVQGQRLDLVFAAEGRLDPASTRRVAAAKSGAYTVRHPLELGATLARPAAPPPAWLASFGENLGQAFALADDLLGVWGDPARTGKPVGDDIAQRKPSTVLGIADEVLGGGVSARFRSWNGEPAPQDVVRLMRECADAGVREAAQAELDAHVAAAQDALAALPCPDLRAHFHALTRTLATRDN